MKGLIITGSTQAKSVSDSLLLFRKEAAWKGKGEKKGLLYNHHYFICRVYTMENKSQGTQSQIISVSLMVWKLLCFYRGKTNVNLMCVCVRTHTCNSLHCKGQSSEIQK